MIPQAHIVHQTRHRLRLRIREKRQDPEYFGKVQERLAAIKGVGQVWTNSNTGSIVVLHPEKRFEEIAPELQQPDFFEFAAGPEPQIPALVKFQLGFSRINQLISQGTAGVADLRTLSVIFLIALAIRQIGRGSLIGPALPLFWAALDMALRVKKEQTPSENAIEPTDKPDATTLPLS